MIPLGLNIFTWNAAARAVCDQLQPAALLFLDNDGGAAEAAARYPNCKVIARVVSDAQEKHLHEHAGETRRYLQMRAGQTSRSVYINLGCEAPTDRLDLLVSETVDGLKWAAANNVKVAAPHGAFYAIDPVHFPILDPMVDAICARPDLFLFTVDEYSGGHAFSGVVDPAVAGGNEVGHISPEHWKAGPVPTSWRDTQFWHAGRITNYFRYRQALGKPLPLTVITENGMDALGDIAVWLKSLHNTGSVDGTRGWQTLAPQWQDWYAARGWSGDVAFAQMMAAQWREIYAPWPNVLGGCLYCYGTNGDRQWDSYRVDGHSEFFDQLVKMNWKGTPVTPTPVPKPSNAGAGSAATLSEDYNLRQGPGTEYASVIVLKKGAAVTYYPTTERKDAAGKFDFVVVEGAGKVGWMANQGQFLAPLPAYGDAKVLLDVPYVDQNNKDTAPDRNDCGQACVVGVDAYVGYHTNQPELTRITVNQANDHLGNTQLGTNGQQLTVLLQLTGKITAYTKVGVTPDFIRQQLDTGLPFIALVQRGELGNPKLAAVTPVYKLAHWITVIGYGDGFFVINDPYAGQEVGYRAVVTEAAFAKAFSSSTFTGGTNAGNQGVYLNADTLKVSTPPDPDPQPVDVARTWTKAEIVALIGEWFDENLSAGK